MAVHTLMLLEYCWQFSMRPRCCFERLPLLQVGESEALHFSLLYSLFSFIIHARKEGYDGLRGYIESFANGSQ